MAAKKKTTTKKRARPSSRAESLKHGAPTVGFDFIPGELKVFDPMAGIIDTSTLTRLRTFAEAHHGADLRVIVNKAVEAFIDADLSINSGVAGEM